MIYLNNLYFTFSHVECINVGGGIINILFNNLCIIYNPNNPVSLITVTQKLLNVRT